MISAIKGKLFKASPLSATIEVHGLFYEVNIPITTAERLPRLGEEVFLHALVVYREDAQTMYGFASASDKDFFKLLVEKVSGIGPKIAINIMSRMSVETLQKAIESGDTALLSKCPGIGKKTAERLVVELRGAFGQAVSASAISAGIPNLATPSADALAALVALGYKAADADKSIRAAISKLGENASTEEIIKQALRG